jgi:hypothetical protein
MSSVLGLFDLRLEIKILLIVAVALAGFAVTVRGKAPGVASRAAWGLAGVAAAFALALGVVQGFETLTISEQIREIKQRASKEGKVAYEWPASFQGGGSESRLFYFEERDLITKLFRTGVPRPSGEIRIYDVRDDELKEAFRFQPDTGKTAVFRYRFLGDLDRDGDDELIGGYGRPAEYSEAYLPFALFWDDGSGRYRVTALQTQPPDRYAAVPPRPNARTFRAGYREQVTFRDESEHLSMIGYRLQDFAVTEAPARLIGGLAVDVRSPRRTGEVELVVSQLRFSGEDPRLLPCRLRTKQPLRADWPNDRALNSVLLERWRRANPFCQPIFAPS